MTTVVKTIDGQLVIVIPPEVAAQANLQTGSKVAISVESDQIVIRAHGGHKYKLSELVAQITDDNRHELIDWGPPIGREVW